MFTFNGKEFRFEAEDYGDMSRFRKALEELANAETELASARDNGGFNPEYIRDYCQMVFRFFDTVLGEGTVDQMFEGKLNMGTCEEAYVSFVEYVIMSAQEAAKSRIQRRERLNQYLPGRRPHEAERSIVS